jgi:acetyl-CoA carboxylase beta subunit
MDTPQLKLCIKLMKHDVEQNTFSEEELKSRYPSFFKQCPTLFAMIYRKDLDDQKLNMMLSYFAQVKEGSMTYENASKDVGQKLFDEYVKPIVGDKEENKKI